MERLTINLPDEPNYIPDESAIYVSDEFGARCYIGEAIDKLAEYEDAEEQGLLVRFASKNQMDERLDGCKFYYCESEDEYLLGRRFRILTASSMLSLN